MSSLVYLRGELIDTTTHYAELRDLYENRHRYNRMPLTCTREHRGRMYLRLSRTDKNRLEVAHYPGQGGPSCTRTIHHEPNAYLTEPSRATRRAPAKQRKS